MSLFAVQTIWTQTQYYGCCNQHGFPALCGFGRRSQKPEVLPYLKR